jgi:hypothetical protein
MNAAFIDNGREAWVMSTKKVRPFFSQGRSEVSDSYVETRFGLRTGERCVHAVGPYRHAAPYSVLLSD